jgi:hypothetical protein
MKNYVAQLADNIVEAIIVGDYDWAVAHLAGEWHDLGAEPLTIGIGYIYDPVTDTFTPPPTPEAVDETV